MTNWENTYETLLRMREHRDRVKNHLVGFASWLTAKERADMEKTVGELERDIKELQDMCIDEGICPDCGSKIIEQRCEDPNFPYRGVDICEGCGRIWDRWE